MSRQTEIILLTIITNIIIIHSSEIVNNIESFHENEWFSTTLKSDSLSSSDEYATNSLENHNEVTTKLSAIKTDQSGLKSIKLQQIRVNLDAERCSNEGVCRNFNYNESNQVVFIEHKPIIEFVTDITYKIAEEPHYRMLIFIESQFKRFPLNLFQGATAQLEELDMRNCSLELLNWENFIMADHLLILLLSNNQIKTIPEMTFNYAGELAFLFLDSNQIETLHRDSFFNLRKLQYLDLQNNRLANLSVDVFRHLNALLHINLDNNRLQVIADGLFENNRNLNSVHLQYNHLNTVRERAFALQDNLQLLDISNNWPLQTLNLSKLNVEYFWARNCSVNRINVHDGRVIHVDLQENYIREFHFSEPKYIETLNLRENNLGQLLIGITEVVNLRNLDLSNNPNLINLRLPISDADETNWQLQRLEHLDLSNVGLKQLPISIIAKTATTLPSTSRLKYLNVSHNNLQDINPRYFEYLQNLKHFYLHNNNWNCYNLQLIMDLLIGPYDISYTYDEYDNSFPGEYIRGIKCMYRSLKSTISSTPRSLSISVEDTNKFVRQVYDDTASDEREDYNLSKNELNNVRNELRTIVNFYEQKYNTILSRLIDLEQRMEQFETLNNTLWQHVTITV